MKKEIFECDCHAEHLVAESSEDHIERHDGTYETIKTIDVAFFSYGHIRKPSFRRRIEICWKILTKGTIFNDMVILSSDEAKRFSKFLSDNS